MAPVPLTTGARDDCVEVHGTRVFGLPIDLETRCVHWHDDVDVVAIRFPCCDRFHPCHACHAEVADHAARVWGVDERETHAILCGACGATFSIADYLVATSCLACGAGFNPGCHLHHELYFA